MLASLVKAPASAGVPGKRQLIARRYLVRSQSPMVDNPLRDNMSAF